MTFSQQETVYYSRRNTALGVGVFLLDALILIGLLWGALCASSIGAQFCCAIAMGPAIAVLFVVGHDAGHQSLTRRRWMNDLIGRLALLPALHPYSLWIRVHNHTHHRWTNLSPHDYVWTPLSLDQFRSLSRFGRWKYTFYRSWAGPLLYYFVEFWIRRIMFPSRREVGGTYRRVYVADILFVGTIGVGYLAFLCVGGHENWFHPDHAMLNALLFGACIPFMAWNTVMSFVIYLHHTHPDLVWYNDEAEWKRDSKQAEAAVHVIFPGPINLLFHWIMEHNAHHARPSIPLYHLREAQRTLAGSGDRIVVLRWTPRAHLDVVRRCKLYDYKAKRWVDFSGAFTSDALPQVIASAGSTTSSKVLHRTDQAHDQVAPPPPQLDGPSTLELNDGTYQPD